jgi:metal-responsive CopG/Arc/MetJ family transcriptional regulator
MVDNGFTPVSISDFLIDRIDKVFKNAGFNTRAGYIQDRLRRAVEKDEKNSVRGVFGGSGEVKD